MGIGKVCLGAAILAAYSTSAFSQTPAPLTMTKGRLAISHDGNAWDKDDVMAIAMEYAVISAFGMQKRLVHMEHSVIGPGCNAWKAEMLKSAEEGIKQFPGFEPGVLFDTWANIDATVKHFADEANKSTADNPLVFVLAGPMDVAWRDLNATAKDKRKFITVISHSTANEVMGSCLPGGAKAHMWADLISSFQADGVKFYHMSHDQNSNLGGKGSASWNFMKAMTPTGNIPASAWAWVPTRDYKANGDVSDGGMVWYALTGSENGVAADFQARFKAPLPMLPAADGTTRISASNTFRNGSALTYSVNNKALRVTVDGSAITGSIKVFNALSQKVEESSLVSGHATVALDHAPAGNYYLNIESKGESISRSFQVK
jgi:hypothetical protein